MSAGARALLLRAAFTLALLASLAMGGCGPAPLPEAGSPAARLYANQCSQCHAPYNPHEMTGAMWEMQVAMMDQKMREAGMAPIAAGDREAILDYLKRNAGTE